MSPPAGQDLPEASAQDDELGPSEASAHGLAPGGRPVDVLPSPSATPAPSGITLGMGTSTLIADGTATKAAVLFTDTQGQTQLVVGSSTTTLPSGQGLAQQVSTHTLDGQTIVASAGSLFLQAGPTIGATGETSTSRLVASVDGAGNTLLAIGSSTLTLPGASALSANTFTFAEQTFVQSAGHLIIASCPTGPSPMSMSTTSNTALPADGTVSTDAASPVNSIPSTSPGVGDYVMSGIMPGSLISTATGSPSHQSGSTENTSGPAESSGEQCFVNWLIFVLLLVVGAYIGLAF